jgi:hypothetical protein
MSARASVLRRASRQLLAYIPRPSQTQEQLNPKLAPQLTTEVLDDPEPKQNVADEQLAKKEAEGEESGD